MAFTRKNEWIRVVSCLAVFLILGASVPLTASFASDRPVLSGGNPQFRALAENQSFSGRTGLAQGPFYVHHAPDPVNLRTGNLVFPMVDLSIPGRGLSLEVTRTYNSRLDFQGPFGYSWTSQLFARVYDAGNSRLILMQGDGSLSFFTDDATAWKNRDTVVAAIIQTYRSQDQEKGQERTEAFYENLADQLKNKPSYFQELRSELGVNAEGKIDSKNALPVGVYNLDRNPSETLQKTVEGYLHKVNDTYTERFDLTGRLTNISERSNSIRFTYTQERLLEVVDAHGRALVFEFDVAGRVVRVTDPLQRRVSYEYDADGNLVKSVDVLGQSSLYQYDSTHNLTKITYPNGGATSIVYDPEIDVVLSEDGPGRKHTAYAYEFGSNGASVLSNTTTVTDGEGGKLVYEFSGEDRLMVTDPVGAKTLVEYSKEFAGRPVRVTDPAGGVSEILYDSEGKVSSLRNAAGLKTEYSYNSAGKLLSIKDARGEVTRYTYDVEGNLVSRTDALGATLKWQWSRDGLLEATVDARGNASRLEYDRYDYPAVATNALGQKVFFTHDVAGRLTRIENGKGHVFVLEYDPADRATKVTDPAGKSVQVSYTPIGKIAGVVDKAGNRTRIEYDDAGLPLKILNALDQAVSFEHDRAGRPVAMVDQGGNRSISIYDAAGRLVRQTNALGGEISCAYDVLSRVTTFRDALGQEFHFTYDVAGRVLSVVNPAGDTIRARYDDAKGVIELTSPNGYSTRYRQDAIGRLVEVVNPLGNLVSLAYDANGNLTGVTDGNGHTRRQDFDSLNRLVSATNPMGQQEKYTYDDLGMIVEAVEADGRSKRMEYDFLGRLTKVFSADGKSTLASYDELGHLLRLASPETTMDYSYDSLGRIIKGSDTLSGKSVGYTYDELGNRSRMTGPRGETTRYEYDVVSRLHNLKDPTGGTTHFDYDANGYRTGVTYPNGVRSRFAYDSRGLLSSVTHMKSDSTVISKFSYNYDPSGNRLDAVWLEGEAEYSYDKTNQLVQAQYSDGVVEEYAYDAAGNRLSSRGPDGAITYEYDAADRMLKAGGTVYRYDPIGNMVSSQSVAGTTRYGYDANHRLDRVSLPDGKDVGLSYYPFGQRMEKASGTQRTQYFYDGTDLLDETTGGSTRRYINTPGMDDIVGVVTDGRPYYFLRDGMWNVTEMVDGKQQTVARYRYGAFGRSVLTEEHVVNNRRYTSRELDNDTGLYYYRTRYYQSESGRFMTEDNFPSMASDPLTLNRYTYVKNSPENYTDPEGEYAHIIVGAAIGAVVRWNIDLAIQLDDPNGKRGWGLVGSVATHALIGAGEGALIAAFPTVVIPNALSSAGIDVTLDSVSNLVQGKSWDSDMTWASTLSSLDAGIYSAGLSKYFKGASSGYKILNNPLGRELISNLSGQIFAYAGDYAGDYKRNFGMSLAKGFAGGLLKYWMRGLPSFEKLNVFDDRFAAWYAHTTTNGLADTGRYLGGQVAAWGIKDFGLKSMTGLLANQMYCIAVYPPPPGCGSTMTNQNSNSQEMCLMMYPASAWCQSGKYPWDDGQLCSRGIPNAFKGMCTGEPAVNGAKAPEVQDPWVFDDGK